MAGYPWSGQCGNVTSRKGRVSRNRSAHVANLGKPVTSRKGRVSRNGNIFGWKFEISVTSRKGRVSRNTMACTVWRRPQSRPARGV